MHSTSNFGPTVTCIQGSIVGTTVGDVDAFFNIPYASNSGAADRFLLPRDSLPWAGIRDATRPGPVFPQTQSRLTAVMGTTAGFATQSEDAFSVNVWAPSRTDAKGDAVHEGAALPVLVWIHGGGWLTGGAPLQWYHGDRLARSGRVVVVGVNYRLGALGNLYLPGQTDGSMALHDLVAALRWVHANIASFGGDPLQITVCGQSAGAWYTTALASSPLAEGLFRQAILLSLPGSIKPQAPEQAASLARRFCELLDVPADAQALRQLSVQQVLEGQTAFAQAHPVFADIPPTFLPIVSDVLPEDLISAAAAKAPKIRFLLGTLPDEMGAFFAHNPRVLGASDAETLARFQSCFGNQGADLLSARRRERPHLDNYAHLLRAVSDEIFREPTQRFASRIAAAGHDCFVYEFEQASQVPRVGACHCFELPFLFDNFEAWSNALMLRDIDIERSRHVAADFQSAIIGFTESGDPNNDRLPYWPPYSNGRRDAMKFGAAAVGTFSVTGV